jgi:PAS domain S-box-containing protein
VTRARRESASERVAREAAELELRDTKERLRLALEAAAMHAWSRDLSTGDVTQAGDGAHLFGTPIKRIEDVLRRVHPDDRPRVEREIGRALAGEVAYDLEYRVVRPDGQVRWVRSKAAVDFAPGGEPRRMLGVTMDVTQRRTLEREILEIGERERRRIGQDLHDGLGQHLAGVSFRAKALELTLAARGAPEAADAATIASLLAEAIAQASALARGLHPVEFKVDGLATALEGLASRARQLFGVECACDCDPEVLVYDNTAAMHLYRIAQEAVSNAVRHGRARHISIRLGGARDAVELTVRDDGVGFGRAEPGPSGDGMGLKIMRHRAAMIGASLDIRAVAGGGTVLACAYRNVRA